MKSFKDRKAEATRRSLDVLPETRRPPLAALGAKATKCGECQACCTVQRIQALDKPAYQQCSHQCAVGCDIYQDKPHECTHYQCAYTLGLLTGGTEMRPDNFGLIVDFRPALDEKGHEHASAEELITVWEAWSGAALSDRGWNFIQRLVATFRKTNICLVPFKAPQLDANRISFVRLWTCVDSHAGDGAFNLPGDHRRVVAQAITTLVKEPK